MKVSVTNYGGIVTRILVHNRFDNLGDVVLGRANIEDYVKCTKYLGAIFGKYANRIANGKFTLNEAESDADTICNLTNHTYFNLKDEGASSILNHEIEINADLITPTDEFMIPTGELKSVEGTPFDFREPLRHSFDAVTDIRDLYETYLPAFEATVKEGHAESIMCAYNRYLGQACCGHNTLLILCSNIFRDKAEQKLNLNGAMQMRTRSPTL